MDFWQKTCSIRISFLLFALVLVFNSSLFALGVFAKKNQEAQRLYLDWLDTHSSPSQDFYSYANGHWQKSHPIPPEYASWSNFNSVYEKNQNLIHQILIRAAQNSKAKPGSIEQKIGDFYFSGMDEARINQLGIKPLQTEFDRIDALQNLSELQDEIAHLHGIGVNALFAFISMQDYKKSDEMIAAAVQAGLGLPDRDYYLKKDAKFQKIREAYVEHIAKMLVLLGDKATNAASEANRVMNIEIYLAQNSMSQIKQRDPYAVYHMMDTKELAQVTPNFSWPDYFKVRGKEHIKRINLAMPDFFKAIDEALKTIPLRDWQAYLRWHLINTFAPYLSQAFVQQNFKMIAALTGTKKILPRWKQVVNAENQALGFAIGKIYVARYFSPEAKKQALEILKNLSRVLREDIASLNWMTLATRQAALKKLDLMEHRIGYPSTWWDYSTLMIDRGSYVLNVLRANQFLIQRAMNKIGKPVDRTEWSMTPQTVNAYYDVSMNNLNIPAGILQAPFFDSAAPAAVNYGAIGFVMGHEMTHAFDDQGAQFDAQGNLKNWWTASDLSKFKAATQCLVDQFSHYTVDTNLKVQGKLVVGEATADLGGINLAYRAFHRSKAYRNAKSIAGLTPDQQFFLSAAHLWAMNIRREQLRHQVLTDPHPPAHYRVNGSLVNVPAFQKAFHIGNTSPMVKVDRCVIW